MERKKIIRYFRRFNINFFRKFSLSKFLSGFTLIELLVVVAIIGILAATLFFVLNPGTQFAKARDAQRKNDLKQIQDALETYYNDNGYYPNTLSFGAAFDTYMSKVPNDPKSPSKKYAYSVGLGGQAYYLYASLERGTADPQACNGGSACTTAPAGACGAGNICSYGVSSPNVLVSAQTVTPTPTSPPLPTPTPTSPPAPTPTKTPTPAPPTPTPTSPPAPTPTKTPTPAPPTPTSAPMTVTFDDIVGQNQVLNGQYPTGVIDWGANKWWHSGAYESFPAKNFTFNGGTISTASFTFLTSKRVVSLLAYNGQDTASSTVTISCTGNPTVSRSVGINTTLTITTGWTAPCSSAVTISSSNGWKTNFDTIVIQ